MYVDAGGAIIDFWGNATGNMVNAPTTTDDADSSVAPKDVSTTTEEMTQSSDSTVDVMATELSSVIPPPSSYNHVMKSIVLISAASFGVVAMMI